MNQICNLKMSNVNDMLIYSVVFYDFL